MQEHGQRRYANWMGFLLLAVSALASSGCASMYHLSHYNWFSKTVFEHNRPYFHSGHTGRIIAKTHHHSIPVEPDCFGYEPTCWYNWPSHCVPCPPPEQILEDEVVEPQKVQNGAEEVPEQPPRQREGLEGILDLDDPKPGESPILPNRGRGASVAPPTGMRRVAPEPESTEPALSITKQDSVGQLIDDKVVEHAEPESPNVTAWKSAIARRSINQRMVLVDEAVRPERINRDDRPLAFVDKAAEVEDITPVADMSLATHARPAPPAIAPSVVQSSPEATAPSVVQAVSTPQAKGVSSRRTVRFAQSTPKNHLTVDRSDEAAPEAAKVINNTHIEQETEPVREEQPVQAVRNDLPAVQDELPVQMAQHDLPATLDQQPIGKTVQSEARLPSFTISAVGPDAPKTQAKTAASSSATIRFVSGSKPSSVRVSSRGDDSSNLKFR